MSEFSLQSQLAAACTVYPYEAARILNISLPNKLNGVPDTGWFAMHFTFLQAQLREYIAGHPALADKLHQRSLDNRGVPCAYMEKAEGGYRVGWFDGQRRNIQFHSNIEDAATDFVITFWGLPRKNDTSVDHAVIVRKEPDFSPLPEHFVSRATIVGNEACWPPADAENVIRALVEKKQVVLGAEAWQLKPSEKPRVLDWSYYDAEDYLTVPEGVIEKCKELAIDFVRRTAAAPYSYFQIEWVSLPELDRLLGKSTA